MSINSKKLKIGIAGCGAIGSRMAVKIHKDFKSLCTLTGLFDTDAKKLSFLARKIPKKSIKKSSLKDLIKTSDLIIEAVTPESAYNVINESLKSKKHVLSLSVGQIHQNQDLIELAQKKRCTLLIPSGAIAGIDAIKAASLVPFKEIILTTRKPLRGLSNNAYLSKKKIDLASIKKETVLFEGSVQQAVKSFPKNINVAATLALACGQSQKLKVRLITSPGFKKNSHEVLMVGDSGRISIFTENAPCPDNPKTSYLAVLSSLQMLKQYCSGLMIGT